MTFSHKILWALSVALLLFNACMDVEDPNPPQTPLFVMQSSIYDTVEHGIGAVPELTGIRLQWHPNPDHDLDAYVIYRAADTSFVEDLIFTRFDTVHIQQLNPTLLDTEYVDKSVELGIPYYYYLRAMDDAGNLSSNSDTVHYKLDVKALILEPHSYDPANTLPDFIWQYSIEFQYAIDFFYIRLENITKNELIWFYGISRQNYDNTEQIVPFNDDGKAREGTLSPLFEYRWRLDAIGSLDENGLSSEGSKSQWINFNIKD